MSLSPRQQLIDQVVRNPGFLAACHAMSPSRSSYWPHTKFPTVPDGIDGLAVDEEGDELANEGALRAHVMETARDLQQTRIGAVRNWADCTFEVTDKAGHLVLTLPFTEALS